MKQTLMAFEVSVDVLGTPHVGTYSVDRGLITVRSLYGSDSTQLGKLPEETAARILLRELVDKAKARGEW
ncbi:hypothetical protein N5C72_18545 [Achromobacter mucicolens]|uniref:Uncharacterized protein n=1 Tax=Achromobacter mucicolens TaxID=1389922 RepID=A0ABD4YXR1_9BURK|nr:hypothetical protein [Achromobacter mucicolens]MDH1180090.1 hypothetical protein [Achromobacter mucicolens]